MKKIRYKYPDSPGWKELEVSRANAKAGARRFTRMQGVVLALYENGFVGTADDAADRLHLTPFSVRPRCTELVKQGVLEKKRIDRSMPGRHAWVLALAESKTPLPDQAADLFDEPATDGQPSEVEEWHDYDPEC